eukprot:CAMPEP_0196666562 /NCGR_PEP_ID=MMETSP1086-20130531/64583_2 /TAXON_ID=77921 /ORGANISM="Cyanoptyche  gloeocystis , Strain SAG4.97" /LENGTH=226 /DNA_ID=CAMNT_0042003771 /DNA_START=499 /DNA_END=1180 /DNA_ORIENTATION=-
MTSIVLGAVGEDGQVSGPADVDEGDHKNSEVNWDEREVEELQGWPDLPGVHKGRREVAPDALHHVLNGVPLQQLRSGEETHEPEHLDDRLVKEQVPGNLALPAWRMGKQIAVWHRQLVVEQLVHDVKQRCRDECPEDGVDCKSLRVNGVFRLVLVLFNFLGQIVPQSQYNPAGPHFRHERSPLELLHIPFPGFSEAGRLPIAVLRQSTASEIASIAIIANTVERSF